MCFARNAAAPRERDAIWNLKIATSDALDIFNARCMLLDEQGFAVEQSCF
jgi:hypothetical protein